MRKNIRTLDNLKDSRIMFDKEPPAFGYLLILIVGFFLVAALVWSIKTPKMYTIQATGVVTNENSNYLMATYTGQIDECNLEEGKLVKEGDVLFTVKSTDYNLQEVQLEENRKVYELQIKQNQKLVKAIKDDKNYFDESKAEDSLYYSAFESYKSKVKQQTLDVSTYKSYGYTDAQIEAELLKNQSKIDEIYYSSIQSAETSIEQANQQIASIDAQLKAIEDGQEAYQVKANASGTLHLLDSYKSGMVVQTTTAVATITPENSKPILESYVSTADMARMNVGDEVQIVVDGLSQSVYGAIKGKVAQIDSNVTTRQGQDGSSVQTFKVLIDMDSNYVVGKGGNQVNVSNGMTAVARIQYDKVTYFNYILEKLGFIAYGAELDVEDEEAFVSALSEEDENDLIDTKEPQVEVADIEISDYEKDLDVGKTMTLTANVFPKDATDSNITYTSSNTNIATVNSSGEVKGISKGKVTITLTSGKISKQVELNVKVATTGIKADKEYLTLKPGETYQLNVSVTPTDANQSLIYTSGNSDVATVNANGLITAKNLGSTSIIVSNGDSSISVSVIVNKSVAYPNLSSGSSAIVQNEDGKITLEEEQEVVINASETDVISKELLQAVYEFNGILKVMGNGYFYIINGEDIVNPNNEMLTDIALKEDKEGIHFSLNNGKELCGEIALFIDNHEGKYLYLYNESKDKYQQLEAEDMGEIKLSKGGEYMISDEIIRSDKTVIFYTLIIGTIALLISLTVYIFVKRRYRFW